MGDFAGCWSLNDNNSMTFWAQNKLSVVCISEGRRLRGFLCCRAYLGLCSVPPVRSAGCAAHSNFSDQWKEPACTVVPVNCRAQSEAWCTEWDVHKHCPPLLPVYSHTPTTNSHTHLSPIFAISCCKLDNNSGLKAQHKQKGVYPGLPNALHWPIPHTDQGNTSSQLKSPANNSFQLWMRPHE